MKISEKHFALPIRLIVLFVMLFSTASASQLGGAVPKAQAAPMFRVFLPYIGTPNQESPPPTPAPPATPVPPQPTPPGSPPSTVQHSYTPSSADIVNPERGFRAFVNLLGQSNFAPYRDAEGYALVHANIHLDNYRASSLPASLLAEIDAAFGRVRQAGIKVVLRFTYNSGPYPDSEPDASKEWVLRHISQLTPTLQKNADVIAWLEAGFIGAWGEWHTSTNGLDNPTDKRDILNALLAALPRERMVQVRTVADIQTLYPNPLTAQQAFNGSAQARVGHHNDCFLASDTDMGTYRRSSLAADKAYISQIGRFTPVGGETCEPNPPRSSCATALQELAMLHFGDLNEDYHPDVINAWKAGGCYAEIRQRLGYRFALQSAAFEPRLSPGSTLHLSVALENKGFAAPVNPRPLLAVLDGPANYAFALAVDPRRWEPGPASFSAQLRLPADIPAGTYRLSLWLPDAAASLRLDPRYAIRFANEGTWEERTGRNLLGEIIIR